MPMPMSAVIEPSMFWPTAQRKMKFVSCAIAALMLVAAGAKADPDPRASLAMIRLESPGELIVSGQPLDRDMLHAFYAYRHYDLAWNGTEPGLCDRAAEVYATLASARQEGLEPTDYHVREITALANATSDVDRLNRDLLM